MSWLLKRSEPLAKAGHWEDFDRADENPIQQPWGKWGGSLDMRLESNRLVLSDTNGGVGYEHQALTPDWGFEFDANFASYSTGSDFGIYAYIGDNWTIVGEPAQYVLGLAFENDYTHDPGEGDDTASQRIRVRQVDKAEWLFGTTGVMSKSLGSSTISWGGPWPKKVRARIFDDSYIAVWVDNIFRGIGNMAGLEAQPGPGRRAINFAKRGSRDAYIDNFAIYDYLQPLPSAFNTVLFDNFDRTNNSTVPGGGWTKTGGQMGIQSNALAVTGISGDGTRQVWRPSEPTPSTAQRFQVVFGGPNALDSLRPTGVIMRINAAGTAGLVLNFYQGSLVLSSWTGSIASNSFTLTQLGSDITGPASGVTYSITLWDDYLWAQRMDTGEMVFFADGLKTHATYGNRHYGIQMYRSAFFNSASMTEFRALDVVAA